VIIRRWSEMTGCEAVLEATGETFAKVEARRREEGPVDSAPQSAHIEDGVAPDEADELPDITATGATCNKEDPHELQEAQEGPDGRLRCRLRPARRRPNSRPAKAASLVSVKKVRLLPSRKGC
jgi:hypothetical protein